MANGSSPRWRGAQRLRRRLEEPLGIIPALAGSTPAMRDEAAPGEDHPRVGGEHLAGSAADVVGEESSPRWRGAPRSTPWRGSRSRIIPALAGSTCRGPIGSMRPADHPRVGGEHLGPRPSRRETDGSSPRWRGAPAYAALLRRPRRIIPALAGSTATGPELVEDAWDHPRVGGEHRPPAMCETRQPGSSPRWRGAPDPQVRGEVGRGIIPALAGSTRRQRRGLAWSRDHPRVGGEHGSST